MGVVVTGQPGVVKQFSPTAVANNHYPTMQERPVSHTISYFYHVRRLSPSKWMNPSLFLSRHWRSDRPK